MKYVFVSILTAIYAIFWVMCLFMLFGFLMPNPAKLARSISGSNKKKKNKGGKSYSLNEDDYLTYEIIDD